MALTEHLSTLKMHYSDATNDISSNQIPFVRCNIRQDHHGKEIFVTVPVGNVDKAEENALIRHILNTARNNQEFWLELLENSTAALNKFKISDQAKAAIASGDIQWIYKNVAGITEEEMAFLYKRLEVEAW